MLNRDALRQALRACSLLSCKIQPSLVFDRKHYAYHDLPIGYQITQHRYPIGFDGTFQSIPISRIQLETDTAKLLNEHDGQCMLDFNRSGLALIEIVTEPQFNSVDSVVSFVTALNSQLSKYDIIDRNIEDGSFRIDANVNIRLESKEFPKVEIKNVMGFKFLQQALEFEYARQVSCIRSGNEILPETRMFCQKSKETYSMRDKQVHSYNFIPEHNIPLIPITNDAIEAACKDNLKYSHFYESITKKSLFQLENSSNSVDLFSNMMKQNPKLNQNQCINWICNDLLRICNKKLSSEKQKILFSNVTFATLLNQIIHVVEREDISKFSGIYLLEQLVDNYSANFQSIESSNVMEMIRKDDLGLIKDDEMINEAVERFLVEFPKRYCSDFIKYYKGKYCPQRVAKQFSKSQIV